MKSVEDIVKQLLLGDRRSIARAITLVENQDSSSLDILNGIHKNLGRAHRVGITGPPGAGKSTLVSKLAKDFNSIGKKVGIVAVDPTSPFTGGAILGDRVRMMELSAREGIFIRSMATRGSLGGLSKTTQQAADVLDAAGFDLVLLETVGVGQSELDVVEVADTTVVVLTPESGDSVQAMKAGLMEIADFFVLNKADRPGVEQSHNAITTMLQISPHHEGHADGVNGWTPFIVKTVASESKGIEEVRRGIEKHYGYLLNSRRLSEKRKARIKRVIFEIVSEKLHSGFWTQQRLAELDRKIDLVMNNSMSAIQVADTLAGK